MLALKVPSASLRCQQSWYHHSRYHRHHSGASSPGTITPGTIGITPVPAVLIPSAPFLVPPLPTPPASLPVPPAALRVPPAALQPSRRPPPLRSSFPQPDASGSSLFFPSFLFFPGTRGRGGGRPAPHHRRRTTGPAQRGLASRQAQVAFLQGERKGQENLKTDLVRRIKMLEYALKQERSKYHKLKFGTDLNPGEKRPEAAEPAANGPAEAAAPDGSPSAWKEGRQLLRQYLEEVGYTDTVLDMRSKRVRSLLGRCSAGVSGAADGSEPALRGGDSPLVRRIEEQIQRNAAGKEAKERPDASVLERLPFLRSCEDEDSDEDEEPEGPRPRRKQRAKLEDDEDDDEDDSEDALNEFDFLGSGADGAERGAELERRRVKLQGVLAELRDVDGLPAEPPARDAVTMTTVAAAAAPRARSRCRPAGSLGLDDGAAVSLGDLADLTVANDDELSGDAPAAGALPKPWTAKFTLRSHYDGVRALAFHHAAAALLTASEDGTLKLWNLHRPPGAPKKNAAALDVEPVYAFRGHRGPVLAVAMGPASEFCCSGGADGRIRCWRLPDLDTDPYDGYDPGVLRGVLEGHGDAVWALAFSPGAGRLASCSADGTLRLWDPGAAACLSTYAAGQEHGVPTSLAFAATQPGHVVTAFRSGAAVLYDAEAARPVLAWSGGSQINQVASHPTEPLTVAASDDGGIRFLDNRTGKAVHSMVAHLDAVTCLAVDPSGAFLLSGSHDCSLRLWHLGSRTCVQEIAAHRRKHAEAVHAVAFHPGRALSASAGADALAKVFA
ncbi:striatin-4 isoform X2 [Struthio camelus]|uniref:striatin-4 isoform X2 n=1 Tax=Struthio camelus TaxID=8801 RepID=UPI003603B886